MNKERERSSHKNLNLAARTVAGVAILSGSAVAWLHMWDIAAKDLEYREAYYNDAPKSVIDKISNDADKDWSIVIAGVTVAGAGGILFKKASPNKQSNNPS